MKKKSIFDIVNKKITDGDYKNAESILKELLKKNDSDPISLKLLAWCHSCQGNFIDSLILIDRALLIDESSSDLLFLKAYAYYKLNNFDEAKKIIEFSKINSPLDQRIRDVEGEILLLEAVNANSHLETLKYKFDSNSNKYDDGRSLAAYETPRILYSEAKKIIPNNFGRVLDLGCGTGLSGELFRGDADYLCGVDLSTAMLEKALHRKIYNELTEMNILSYLEESISDSWNLIIACSVFIYFSDLNDLFKQINRVLVNGGVVCFDLNLALSANDYEVFSAKGMQFSHSRNYVIESAQRAGLTITNTVDTHFQYIKIGQKDKGVIYTFTKLDSA